MDPDLQRLLGELARGASPLPLSATDLPKIKELARRVTMTVGTWLLMLLGATLVFLYGVKAWRIRRPGDVNRVLRKAHEYRDGPCVVVAEVVKDDNVFPMIPSGAPVSGMIIEKPRRKLEKPVGST